MNFESTQRAILLLKAISHPSRLLILRRLVEGACGIDEFQRILGQKHAVVSTHLSRLRFGHVIIGNRIGKTVLYELVDKDIMHLVRLIDGLFFEAPESSNSTTQAHIEFDSNSPL